MTAPTITEFITARLDEWEQAAREAKQPDGCGPYLSIECLRHRDHAHVELHDPAATLALVAALRAVTKPHDAPDYADLCISCEWKWPCPPLRHMAAIWADHPDYDGSWRP